MQKKKKEYGQKYNLKNTSTPSKEQSNTEKDLVSFIK